VSTDPKQGPDPLAEGFPDEPNEEPKSEREAEEEILEDEPRDESPS
jgi:hypothetical protein